MDEKKILDFLGEAGLLKRVKRSGWWMIGIPEEESVADHSFRCAVIGYALAKMEGADAYKVLLMTLFGDIHEARINDMHKVAHRYLDVKSAEKKAFAEQIGNLEGEMHRELKEAVHENEKQQTLESQVARDADILECLIQAKEYHDLGYPNARKFFQKAPEHLRTKSAHALWEKAQVWDSNAWWEKIGKFERKE